MDTQAKGRGPSAEKPGVAEHRSDRPPARERDQKISEQSRDEAGKSPRSLKERTREHWVAVTSAAAFFLVVLIGGLVYWLDTRNYEWTDDAFIAARSFSVAAKVGGYVRQVPVTDNQHVNAGDLLARIDPRDYKTALDQAQARVAVAQANIDNIRAQIESQRQQIDQAKAQLDQADAQLKFAQQEESRASDLVQKGAGTVQREQQTPAGSATPIPGIGCS